MSLVYDDIYEITSDNYGLILLLQDKGILGNFEGGCKRCSQGRITLKRTPVTAETVLFGDARRRNAVIRFL